MGQSGQDRRRRVDRPAAVGKAVLKINAPLRQRIQKRRIPVTGIADAGVFGGKAFNNDNDDVVKPLLACSAG